MTKMEQISLLVNSEISKSITKKECAEIVTRRSDGKIDSITKCKLVSDPGDNSSKIANSILNHNATSIDTARSIMNNANINSKTISRDLRNLSVKFDSAFRSLTTLSYINTGLSLVNTAVNIVGFVVISKKLNSIKDQLTAIENKAEIIIGIKKTELIQEFQQYIMRINSVYDCINNHDQFDFKATDDLIIGLKSFISKLINNLVAHLFESDLLIEMIYALLPAYTLILNEYLKRYFVKYNGVPSNYKIFMSLYNELYNCGYRTKMIDHLILNKKLHIVQALDIVNSQLLCVLNNKIQIEDNMRMIEVLQTKEKIAEYDCLIDNIAKDLLLRKASSISKDTGLSKEECLKVINGWF